MPLNPNNGHVVIVGLLTAVFGGSCQQQTVLPPASGTVKVVHNGIEWTNGQSFTRIRFYGDNKVRVIKWVKPAVPEPNSLVVIASNPERVKLSLAEDAYQFVLCSDKLTVRLSKENGTIEYQNAAGQTLLKEQGPPAIHPVEIPYETNVFSLEQRFTLRPEEGLYGLGQHQDGYMNYRGRTVTLVQSNTEAAIPFLVSTGGWGILWDNYSKTIFSDSIGGMSFHSEVGRQMDYYFIAGRTMDEVIAGYRDLTGQAPLYGKWAYGYWQSKEHYKTRQELLSVAEEYRRRQIPIDNLIQDWNYWGGNNNWGGMVFDETRYPNPKEMVDLLHQINYHLMISIWPGLGPDTAVFKEMDRNGFLYPPFGWAGFKYYDAYNPQANAVYWNYLKEGLISKGIDAWWIDSTEPDVINALTKEGTEAWLKYIGRNHRGSFARYLNTYSLVMTDALYQNLRKENEQKRVYILTRSSFAGQQRNAAATWSGDIGANWETYRKQISAGLNHCMAGVPYWTFDIGGFVIGSYGGVFSNGGKDPAYQELYTRMFQFGAFCPIFRAHGSETPREIWELGDFTDILIRFDRLRYRLLPYIYSLAWRITREGYTLMRGLPMDFAEDRRTYSIDDEFMFGPALLVCPVTEYMLHRPPEDSVLIGPEHFRTPDGKRGLKATYYSDANFQQVCRQQIEPNINLFWYTGWPDFIEDETFSMRWEGKLIPTQSGPHRFHMKSFGPKRLFLDGKEVPCNYWSVEFYTVPVELEAGRAYDFAFETSNSVLGAFRAQLFWKTPDIHRREKQTEPRKQTRSVYLPAGTEWVDFWTGKRLAGGQTLQADAPIDRIPLYVRAGTILPMGPFVQYAAEKPADPIELRIYPGTDGAFVLYEDENDGYNYEKGAYSTIEFRWNEQEKTLTIGERKGSFDGMLKNRTFQIVFVRDNYGTGIEITKQPDALLYYSGVPRQYVWKKP
ncbi:MAG TPA: glycoside hydrolase family 31 protein [Anaerohalosphaeraceae bacterium]|nr:glycoside hydrolase family 31 protein [Anaerohalosphaeraceae bacterium]